MHIEISDAQIKEIAEKYIRDAIKSWFEREERKSSGFMRDMIINVVHEQVRKSINDSGIDVSKLAESISTKQMAELIADSIGYNIASIFVNKYDN